MAICSSSFLRLSVTKIISKYGMKFLQLKVTVSLQMHRDSMDESFEKQILFKRNNFPLLTLVLCGSLKKHLRLLRIISSSADYLFCGLPLYSISKL